MAAPWDDCKIAFGMDNEEAFESWLEANGADESGDLSAILPNGWELSETDGAGARWVVVFRVNGPVRERDGRMVRAMLRKCGAIRTEV